MSALGTDRDHIADKYAYVDDVYRFSHLSGPM